MGELIWDRSLVYSREISKFRSIVVQDIEASCNRSSDSKMVFNTVET